MSELKHISKAGYLALLFLTFFLALGIAIQNGFYGFEQGTTPFKSIITCSLFFIGDVVLIILARYLMPSFLMQFLSYFVFVGLSLLSIFAASAFLIGQQHQIDLSSQAVQIQKINELNAITDSAIAAKKKEISQLENHIATLPPGWYTNRTNTQKMIREVQKEIGQLMNNRIQSPEIEKSVSPENAIYAWIALAIGSTEQIVSLIVRVAWAIIFVFASIVMGGLLRFADMARKQNQRTTPPEDKKPLPAPEQKTTAPRTAPDNVFDISTAPRSQITTAPTAPIPADMQDTGRYSELVKAILSGAVKPSTRAVKNYGIGSKQAGEHLKQMLEEGHLLKSGQGYKLNREGKQCA
jgi:hypothetical protein